MAVPDHHQGFTNQVMGDAPEKTYNTFAEADAAAEAEARSSENAYGQNNSNGSADVTRKSAFKSGMQSNAMKTPNDNFARVTWTDLAAGRGSLGTGDGSRA